jgi:hypothetical protein
MCVPLIVCRCEHVCACVRMCLHVCVKRQAAGLIHRLDPSTPTKTPPPPTVAPIVAACRTHAPLLAPLRRLLRLTIEIRARGAAAPAGAKAGGGPRPLVARRGSFLGPQPLPDRRLALLPGDGGLLGGGRGWLFGWVLF